MLSAISTEGVDIIEHFIVHLYDRSCPYMTAEKCQMYLFTLINRAIEAYAATKDALVKHVRRVMLQCDVWSSCT